MKKYTVVLSRTEYQTATVVVEAESLEDAATEAMDSAVFEVVDAQQSIELIEEKPNT